MQPTYLDFLTERWEEVLLLARQRNPTVEAALRTGCYPTHAIRVGQGADAVIRVTVSVPYPFLIIKLEDQVEIIGDVLSNVMDAWVSVEFQTRSLFTPRKESDNG